MKIKKHYEKRLLRNKEIINGKDDFHEKVISYRYHAYFCAIKWSDIEFMQYRWPVGLGPSSNTCPRCPPQRAHTTSVRSIPRLLSVFSRTASFETGVKKLGHPLPESNLVSEENSVFPHPAQTYVPSPVWWTYFPLNGGSVPFFRSTKNSSGVSIFFHSSSDFFTIFFSLVLFPHKKRISTSI